MESTFDRIKKLCKLRHITIKELAEQAGVTRQAMYGWKSPDANPNALLLDRVAEALDADVFYLMLITDSIGHYQRHRPSQEDQITELHKHLSNALNLINSIESNRNHLDPDVEDLADLIQQLSPQQRLGIRQHVSDLLK